MSSQISHDKLTISKVFENWYCIPSYQRAYVWERDQVSDLLDDISVACEKDTDGEYFLGSLVLQEKKIDNYIEFDVLDGQQRLTTLFLIMAVIRDLATDKNLKETCKSIVFQEYNRFKKIPERLRVVFNIRDDVKDFVNKYIKEENGTLSKDLIEYTKNNQCSLSVTNMVNAILYIKEYFQDKNIDDFSEFLINNVVLIYVSTKNLDDAFKLFTVLNNRGIKLRSADILKAHNLSLISDINIGNNYAKNWEDIENYFGENFDEFLSYLQSILTKEKSRLNLLDEFEKNIFQKNLLKKGKDFFDFVKKYKEHYEYIFDNNKNLELKNLLNVMKAGFASSLWVAPLLSYYNKFGSDKLLEFTKKLNNKFASDWICRLTPTNRISNMNKIIEKIEEVDNFDNLVNDECLSIDKKSILEFFDSDIYGTRQARYALLLTNYLFHSHQTPMSLPDVITIEHILPQNPSDNSQWKQDFDGEAREKWTNKIGNLIIISRKKNSSQGNLDFIQKKENYFKGNVELGRSAYVMSKQSWTPDDLKENHDEVLKKLKENYDIKE